MFPFCRPRWCLTRDNMLHCRSKGVTTPRRQSGCNNGCIFGLSHSTTRLSSVRWIWRRPYPKWTGPFGTNPRIDSFWTTTDRIPPTTTRIYIFSFFSYHFHPKLCPPHSVYYCQIQCNRSGQHFRFHQQNEVWPANIPNRGLSIPKYRQDWPHFWFRRIEWPTE